MQYCRHRKMMRGITSTYTKMSRKSFKNEQEFCTGGILYRRSLDREWFVWEKFCLGGVNLGIVLVLFFHVYFLTVFMLFILVYTSLM